MNYIKIIPCDIANGPGVRVTIFVSGCDHHCHGCQNPQTWNPAAGEPFTKKTLNKILVLLGKNYIQGATFSGGDPLQPQNIETVSTICREILSQYGNKKDIWLWTGYLWEEIKNTEPASLVNVIVDGPYLESQKDISLPYAGSRNQRVINAVESLRQNKVVLYDR